MEWLRLPDREVMLTRRHREAVRWVPVAEARRGAGQLDDLPWLRLAACDSERDEQVLLAKLVTTERLLWWIAETQIIHFDYNRLLFMYYFFCIQNC